MGLLHDSNFDININFGQTGVIRKKVLLKPFIALCIKKQILGKNGINQE